MLVGLLVGSVFLQETIGVHPALQKTRDFDVQLGTLPVILKQLSSETGLYLHNGQTIDDLKLDLFVKGQPLSKTLERIADVVDGEWVKEKDGFRLSKPAERTSQEQNYLEAEERLALQSLDRQIKVYKRIAQLLPPTDKYRITSESDENDRKQPYLEWRPQAKIARQNLDAATIRKAPEVEIEPLRVECEALESIASGRPQTIIARLISQMTDKQIQELKAGTPYAISNQEGSQFRFWPSDDPQNVRFGDGSGNYKPPRILALVRVDPLSFTLGSKQFSYTQGGTGTSGNGSADFPLENVPSVMKSHPYIKRLSEWDQATKLPEKFKGPLSVSSPGEPSKWWAKGFRLGEHLRWFHQSTGVPVVALADRSMTKWYSLVQGHQTQTQYLQNLLKMSEGFVHETDGFLMMRNGMYWRHRKFEVPEAAYEPMETAFGKRELTLADYAKFATVISIAQARRLSDTVKILKKFNGRPLGGITALKLYGNLSPSQQTKAKSVGGIKFSEMNEVQRALYRSTMISGLFDSGSVSESFLAAVVKTGLSDKVLSEMSFSLGVSGKGTIGYGRTGGWDPSMPILVAEETIEFDKAPVMRLGYDEANCVSFGFEMFKTDNGS